MIVTTQHLLEELRNTLAKQKFVEYLAALQLSIDEIMTQIEEMAVHVNLAEVPPNIVRDPKDQAVIACAVGGKADFIVTGDKDLLTLVSYESITILTAEQFLERVSNQ
ncbi:MAG: putative toxin-antitoxin system toxin component, PIN family [Anaerolineae bacterium]|nr:putative toxin-antitoxin system toxin component, PIN family [Anaerolineae bacterium]